MYIYLLKWMKPRQKERARRFDIWIEEVYLCEKRKLGANPKIEFCSGDPVIGHASTKCITEGVIS